MLRRRVLVIVLLVAAALAGCVAADRAPAATEPSPAEPPAAPDEHVTPAEAATTPTPSPDAPGNATPSTGAYPRVHGVGGELRAPGDFPAPLPRFALRPVGASSWEPTLGVGADGFLFFPTEENGSHMALRRSTDGGVTWATVDTGHDIAVADLGTVGNPSRDPYVYVDPWSERVFYDYLYPGCTSLAWSDDRGDAWTMNRAACGTPAADHQTLFAAPRVGDGYPSTLHLCFNHLPTFRPVCSSSADGGETWGPALPLALDCRGLHGHGRGAPDGRAYLPLRCGVGPAAPVAPNQVLARPAVMATADAGLTWQRTDVAGTERFTQDDPALTVDDAGAVYYAWLTLDGSVRLSRSTDGAASWSPPMNLTREGEFSALRYVSLVAGDAGRLAVAYHGRHGEGADGQWHAYVAVTLDATAEDPTFVTIRLTPDDDPVQRGADMGGAGTGGAGDFLDMEIAPDGTIYVALVDLCPDRPCVRHDGEGVVAAQVAGVRLRA